MDLKNSKKMEMEATSVESVGCCGMCCGMLEQEKDSVHRPGPGMNVGMEWLWN